MAMAHVTTELPCLLFMRRLSKKKKKKKINKLYNKIHIITLRVVTKVMLE